MYHFSYFKEPSREKILAFVEQYPLAFITGEGLNGYPAASQIPMLWVEKEGHQYLQGHIMRNTDHHKAFLANPHVLVIFTGPNAYVSASWYKDPSIGSTWNYMSVHAKGKIRFMEDIELVEFMKKFTLKFEFNNTQSPTIYDNLPDSFLSKMMPAIVGIEIRVENLDNVFKLSQNRDPESYRNILLKLEAKGGMDALVAEEMRARESELFSEGEEWNPDKFES